MVGRRSFPIGFRPFFFSGELLVSGRVKKKLHFRTFSRNLEANNSKKDPMVKSVRFFSVEKSKALLCSNWHLKFKGRVHILKHGVFKYI